MSDKNLSEGPAVIDQLLQPIREDLSDMKTSMSKIADAVIRLAVLEDRHINSTAVMDKMIVRMEKMEERQHAYELAKTASEARVDGAVKTLRFFWVICGTGGFIGLLKIISLFSSGAS